MQEEIEFEQEKPSAENETDCNQQESKEQKKKKIVSVLRELLIYAIIVVVCIFIIPRYVIQRTIVSGSSMENTLFSDDNLLVEKVSYHFVDPKRFDVVVFYPYGRAAGEYYVKRVIGLPGETIQIKGNDIYINGKKIEEHYGKDPITYQGIASEPLKLGDDEFFLMGDNRKVSFDSRYEEVGPVHRDLLEGKAIIRIWPLKDFGTFD
ncbi:signal peptidase I [Velocimicrobium porci]|uniref:signal peptidase I n=1 Tax=Velocimicrobium porci TaxID=2606634 RepID=UPI0012B36F60|nr:signal peptidase I [Velocimicrobium porci]